MRETLKELFAWRHLLSQLVFKNLKLRYTTTTFGFFWAFLSPLFLSGIYYFVFAILLRVKIETIPFSLYLICGIFPWQFFQNSVVQATTSLLENKNLIRESRFPHFVIPLSVVLTNGIIFLPSLVLMLVLALFFMKILPWFLIALPAVILVFLILTAGMAILVSIVCLKWRDLPHFLELSLTFLFYLTPIVYPISFVANNVSPFLMSLYFMNPFVGMIALFRMAFITGFATLTQQELSWLHLYGLPILFSFVVFFLGMIVYKKNRDWINDALSY